MIDKRKFFSVALLATCVFTGSHWPAKADTDPLAPSQRAWTAWKNGNIDDAEQLASKLPATDEQRHLLLLCAFVDGRYEAALGHYKRIAAAYERANELDEVVVAAYLHLNRAKEAAGFAKLRNVSKSVRDSLALRVANPLRVDLQEVAIIPFAEHPLTAYFPAFRAEINSDETTVHIDTGGTYLIMGPDRAKKFGIQLREAGSGFHGTRRVKLFAGMARSLRLGKAMLHNVPVIAMPSLRGQQDFVIFGTNILEQFHSTLDYTHNRLILSPRNDAKLRELHMSMLPARRVEVPFYLWSDHYMFARGGFGENRKLNYFIDSGLVSLVPDAEGRVRQACFLARPQQYKQWGIPDERAVKSHFESTQPIFLGALQQRLPFVATVKNPSWRSFGGVRIDGLLSHAFLSRYAWTLDFERRRFIFSAETDPTSITQ